MGKLFGSRVMHRHGNQAYEPYKQTPKLARPYILVDGEVKEEEAADADYMNWHFEITLMPQPPAPLQHHQPQMFFPLPPPVNFPQHTEVQSGYGVYYANNAPTGAIPKARPNPYSKFNADFEGS